MSFLIIAHHESNTASVVLNAQTKRKGLLGPSQLTSEKLKTLISTLSSRSLEYSELLLRLVC